MLLLLGGKRYTVSEAIQKLALIGVAYILLLLVTAICVAIFDIGLILFGHSPMNPFDINFLTELLFKAARIASKMFS